MPPLTSQVWQRYGQLRIYVSADGQPVGWFDPRSGRSQVSMLELEPDFWAAVHAECQRLSRAGRITEAQLPTSGAQNPARRNPARQDPARPDPGMPGAACGHPPPGHPALPGSAVTDQVSASPGPAPAKPTLSHPEASGTGSTGPPLPQSAHPGSAPSEAAVPDPPPPRPARRDPASAAAVPPDPAQHWIIRDSQWDDLARNAPGASARARASELRHEHPLLTSAAALLGIRTSAQSFAAGARGERIVGRLLNRWAARYGWHVLHAVPVGQRGADIDHVVIGPFGVVTVNTKTSGTTVWVGEYGMTVGGKPVDYLRKSRREATRTARLLNQATGLDVPVQAAIVFAGARRITIRRGGPADIAVLPAPRSLRRWLRRQPPVLQPAQVDAIYQAARKPASWQGRPPRTRYRRPGQ